MIVTVPTRSHYDRARAMRTAGNRHVLPGDMEIELRIECDRCGVTADITRHEMHAIGRADFSVPIPHGPWTSLVVVRGRYPNGKGYCHAVKTGMRDLCNACLAAHNRWFAEAAHARLAIERAARREADEAAARAEAARVAEERRLAEEARLAAEKAEAERIEAERIARASLIESIRASIAKLRDDAAKFSKRKHTAKALAAFIESDRLRDELAALEAA